MKIALVITSIMSVSFLISYLSVLSKFKSVSNGFAQLFVSYNSLSESIQDASRNDEEIHKENFIKFLSDSRDWAFDYIDDVQSGLKKFIDEVEPHLEYYNNYGIVIEGMIPPHDLALNKISKEFEELKKFLPEETNDRR